MSNYLWPVEGATYGSNITSDFGYRSSPTKGASTNHMGIDIAAAAGTPVLAAASGRVLGALRSNAKGNYIQIQHSDGSVTEYEHLKDFGVTAGQYVTAGQQIGSVGSTGISTGNHLHFGVKDSSGNYIDPLTWTSSGSSDGGHGYHAPNDSLGLNNFLSAVNDYWLYILGGLLILAIVGKVRR